MKCDFDVEKYESSELQEIRNYLVALRDGTTNEVFEEITSSAVACALLLPRDDKRLSDRKYSVHLSTRAGAGYRPVFPLVVDAYQEFFWDSIVEFVAGNEQELLTVCRNPEVTNDVRGRLFERIVINRCSTKATTSLDWGEGKTQPLKCNLIKRFYTQALPSDLPENGIYVPFNSNFPAIDFIWKHEEIVIGVQVHVASREDVLSEFKSMCLEAQWKQNKIYLLYLSPDEKIANLPLGLL